MGFVDGSIVNPGEDNEQQYRAWKRNNDVIITLILNSFSNEISASLQYTDSAKAIWGDLKQRFQQSNGPRIFQIRKDLSSLKQNQLSVGAYFTKLKAIWEKMKNFRPPCCCVKCTCKEAKVKCSSQEYHEQEYVWTFLMGLNDTYNQVRSQILMIDPLPHINWVFSLVVQEEKQRDVSDTFGNPQQMAMVAIKNNNSQQALNKAGTQKKYSNRPICSHCNRVGHTIDSLLSFAWLSTWFQATIP